MMMPECVRRVYCWVSRAITSFVFLIALVGGLCGQARGDFTLKDFSSTDQLVLFQKACVLDGRLLVTPIAGHEFGSAWYGEKQVVQDGFVTTFQFRITGPQGKGRKAQGEGFAFVLQNNRITGLICSPSSYYDIPNSFAIEFDTYRNANAGDPNGNHISFQTRGLMPNSVKHAHSLSLTAGIPDLSDEKIHTVKIAYRAGELALFLDTMQTPVLTAKVDLSKLLDLDRGKAWAGFCAGTRSIGERHEILNWSFTSGGESVPATMPVTTSSSAKTVLPDFRGKMILIELGDPLEDADQLRLLRNGLKRAGREGGIILWVDSPNGDAGLVREMREEIRKLTGPKIAVIGGGRYGGVFGNMVGVLSSFDVVVRFPGAIMGRNWVKTADMRGKDKAVTLPASAIDPDRLGYWSKREVDDGEAGSVDLDKAKSVQHPKDAIAAAGLSLANVELIGPIILPSRMNEKVAFLEAQLGRLADTLQRSVARELFWSRLTRRPKSVSIREIRESLDDLILNACRSEVAIQRIQTALESCPQAGTFVKTEGVITEEWRQDYLGHRVTAKKDDAHVTQSRSSRMTPAGTTRGKKCVRISLYYGGDTVRLRETQAWLEDAIFCYKRIKKDLNP